MRFLVCASLALASAFAPAQRAEPHNYDLVDVSWRVTPNEKSRSIRGSVTNTVVLNESASSVWFDCGPLKISRVMVEGKPAKFDWSNEKLTVEFSKAQPKGKRLPITIDYSGSPTAGVYFVDAQHAYPATTGMVYTQGEAEDNRYWLPTYDFPDDKTTVESYIQVPPGQFALSNGKLIGVDKKPDSWTYHWKIGHPISTYLISFVSGEYVEGKESVGRLPVLWYSPPGTDRWGRAAFAGTNRIVSFFGKQTGFNYPFEKFSQIVVGDFMFGGMENASAVTQTIHTLHKPENEPIANSEGLVAHELAHQWFGDTVTCADWSHIWLNEGFASFMPSTWAREAHGQEEFDAGRWDTFQGAIASQAATKRPMVSNRYEVPMDLFDGQAYGGGAARLFALLDDLGEKTFWQGVKTYLNEYKFKNATTHDFFTVMSRVAKRDLSVFEEQYFHRSSLPTLTVARDGSDVVITQPEPAFDLDLKVSFLGPDRIQKEMPVHVRGARTVLSSPGMEGTIAVADYRAMNLAKIVYSGDFSAQDLLRIYRLAPNVAGKAAAIERFGDKVSDQELLDLARSEKSRRALWYLLPHLKRNAVPLLVQMTGGFDRITAWRALDELARFADDPQAMDRMREIWQKDSNEFLRNTALGGLLKTAKDDALAQSAWTKDSQDEMFRVSALRWWSAHEPKTAREKCLQILQNPPNEPLHLEAIRRLGALKDAPGEHRVFEALMREAQMPSYGCRMAAVDALAGYGDKRAIPVIEPLTKASLFFTSRAAKSAVERLQKSGG